VYGFPWQSIETSEVPIGTSGLTVHIWHRTFGSLSVSHSVEKVTVAFRKFAKVAAEETLRLDGCARDPNPAHLLMLDEVRCRSAQFDILHFHVDLLHLPLFRDIAQTAVTTLHLRLDTPFVCPFYSRFPEYPLVSISEDQQCSMRLPNWVGTVHHGLPTTLLRFCEKPTGGYLAFLGRMSPEKGFDRAIEIARRVNMPLKVAAKIDDADRLFFESHLRPLLDDPLVEYLGEIGEPQKSDFLGQAEALLFPIDWPEPFGLVMIEAMACGTPEIAFRCGAVPEIVEDGLTGYVVDRVDEAVQAVQRIDRLSRRYIRERFETRFSAERMANDYLNIYRQLRRREPALDATGFAEL
jgi:glycosyltransferase involved in cell wall biosynthesis